MAKAVHENLSDDDGRKPGERSGLETHVFPCCKRCRLGVAWTPSLCSAKVKTLNRPGGKYGRKAKT